MYVFKAHLCLGFACCIFVSLGSNCWHRSARSRAKLLTDTLRHVTTPFAWVLTGTEWLPNHLVTSLTAILHKWPYLVCSERRSRICCSDQCTPIHPVIARHRQYTVLCQDRLRASYLCKRKFNSLTDCICTIARENSTVPGCRCSLCSVSEFLPPSKSYQSIHESYCFRVGIPFWHL